MAMEDPTGDVTEHLRQQHLGIWEGIRTQQPDEARQAMLADMTLRGRSWRGGKKKVAASRQEGPATRPPPRLDQGRLMKVAG